MGSERSLAAKDPESPHRVPSSKRRVSRNTREALLDAALEQFSSKGFGGTSIRDLARAVGIRESSVYKHFASKQALLDALIERADAHLGSVAARFGTTITAGADAASTGQRVVGARSVVTRDIPADSLAVGSPARAIRALDESTFGPRH